MHPRLWRTLVFSLILLGLPVQAQEQAAPKESDDMTLLSLLELLNTPISTASKREEKALESPSVVSVVTRDQIEKHGWTSINDVLYSLPGFGPSQDYDRKTVSSRGLFEGWNNNHLLLLVDGIPYNDNIYGSAYTWEITPIFFTKAVEVVRGPGSALYGSNATNGVVQLKTVMPSDLKGVGEAQIRFGQRGEKILDGVVGVAGSRASVVAGVSSNRFSGNGFKNLDGSLRYDEAGRLQSFTVDDSRDSQYGFLKITGVDTWKGWELQFHQQSWNYKTGHGWLWQVPDLGENLQEKREILSLAYRGQLSSSWSQEYLFRAQKHHIQWNVMFYPTHGYGDYYPAGVFEYLDTAATDYFGRAQWSVDLAQESNLLFGVEATRFEYGGDKAHASNIEMATFSPNEGNALLPLGPWLEYLKDHPVLSTGFYAQFTSGKLLGKHVKVVAGLRSDRTSFDYTKTQTEGRPVASKSFSNTSPRLALVFLPKDTLSIKLMVGKAFRAPAPSELGGANTLTLASNIENLKPETLTTTELAMDWIVTPHLNWRLNLFQTKFSDQIAYSAQNANLSTNVYTLTTQGAETELLFGFGNWRGYANLSYAKRTAEEILDNTIQASPDKLTWEPALRAKAGVIFNYKSFSGALSLLHQGKVERRKSEVGVQYVPLMAGYDPIDLDPYRPRSLDAWTSLDLKLDYTLAKNTTLGLVVTNLADTDSNKLVKNLAFPFDYPGERRKLSLVLKAAF